jgi:hypothetical protein
MMMHPMVVLVLLLVSPVHRLRCTLAVHKGVCDFGNVHLLLDMIFRARPAVGFYVLYHPLSLVECLRTCACGCWSSIAQDEVRRFQKPTRKVHENSGRLTKSIGQSDCRRLNREGGKTCALFSFPNNHAPLLSLLNADCSHKISLA